MNQFKQMLDVLIVVVVLWPSTASALTEIALRERVAMNGAVVRLADVAEVTSTNEQEVAALSSLPLMPAPGAGGQRYLRKREIEDLLVAHGMDLNDVQIRGPAHVVISSADAHDIAVPAQNRHAAALAANGQHAWTMDAARAETLRRDIQLIVENYLNTKALDGIGREVTCDVAERHLAQLQLAKSSPVCSGGAAPWSGRQRLLISFPTARGQAQFPVYAEVAPKAVPIVIATEQIPRGAVITAAHIELRTMEHSVKANDRRKPVGSVESLIGMEARQTIAPGAVVYTDQVQSPLLVKRGELITISSAAGGIRVRTTVRALQDRSQGELVQVESLATKERFDARVTGPGAAAIITVNALASVPETIEMSSRR
jgi:flagella basal body P-ring formation protein FlgA